MSLFFEASALTSFYVKDHRTSVVAPLLAQAHPVISMLSLVEVRSGICKAGRVGKITPMECKSLIHRFSIHHEYMQKLAVTEEVIDIASQFIETAVLKAGDALQLATFVIYRRQFDPHTKLVNADNQIHTAATELNLPIIDVRV